VEAGLSLSFRRRAVNLGFSPIVGEDTDFSSHLVALTEPTGRAAETYRTLRTNLLYGFIDGPPRTIVLTSPGAGEGKSVTCANLSIVLAQAGKNTLIVDCDMRKPAVHKIFGLPNAKGLVDILGENLQLHEVWQKPLENLKIITTGLIPFNPADLLGSKRFAEFLSQARGDFDYVLMDASPLQLVSDPIILASQADGVVLVFDAQNTRKRAVVQGIRSLEAVGANVLGTVMNGAKASKRDYYRGAYIYQ
jgi:capsular exopolysaccharide synthesis family protein